MARPTTRRTSVLAAALQSSMAGCLIIKISCGASHRRPRWCGQTRRESREEVRDVVEVKVPPRPPFTADRRRAASPRTSGAAPEGRTRAHLEVTPGPFRASRSVDEGVTWEGRNRNADLEVARSPRNHFPNWTTGALCARLRARFGSLGRLSVRLATRPGRTDLTKRRPFVCRIS